MRPPIKAQKNGVCRTSGSANTGLFGQRCVSAESTYPPCTPSTGCSSESFIITCNKLLKVSVSLSVLVGQEPACQCRRHKSSGLIPGLGRSPGGGHGSPLQYSCLVNPMDRGAWWATVHRVAKSWTWLKQLSIHVCIKATNIPQTSSWIFSKE